MFTFELLHFHGRINLYEQEGLHTQRKKEKKVELQFWSLKFLNLTIFVPNFFNCTFDLSVFHVLYTFGPHFLKIQKFREPNMQKNL